MTFRTKWAFSLIISLLSIGFSLLGASENHAATSSLRVDGDAVTADGRYFDVSGSFDVQAADLTAGTIVLIGDFTGFIAEAGGQTTDLERRTLVAPVLGSGPNGSCETLYLDVASLFTDSLRILPAESAVRLDINSNTTEQLQDSFCRLAHAFDEGSVSPVDQLVFSANDLLR